MVLVHIFCPSKTPGECDNFNSEEYAESCWRSGSPRTSMLCLAGHFFAINEQKCVGTQWYTTALPCTKHVSHFSPPWSRSRLEAVWLYWRHSKCKRCKRRSCLGTCSEVEKNGSKLGFSYDFFLSIPCFRYQSVLTRIRKHLPTVYVQGSYIWNLGRNIVALIYNQRQCPCLAFRKEAQRPAKAI